MQFRIIAIIFSIFLLTGCSGTGSDARLAHVAGIVSDEPEKAMAMLDSIGQDGLSEGDRHFYDLLSVKARDKAYVRHTSDSLILDVIEYYSSHRSDGLYPEALYYGARVYSDMGDLPSALGYFQSALDALPENSGDYDLRGRILSQTGRLLNKLRLYDEAIPYLEGSLEFARNMNDTISEVYDMQLLGSIYKRAHDYMKADSCFRYALWKSRNMPASYTAKSSMHIADIKYRLRQIDSALIYVRHTPDMVKPISRNTALSIAANSYRVAGILDTAYMYAHELVCSADPTDKKTGYLVLLSPELWGTLHPDTVGRYISEYVLLLESFYNENENQLALNQQSLHNYRIHERERLKAESSNQHLRQWLTGVSIVVLLLVIVILFLRNRNISNRLELQAALENIRLLSQSIGRKDFSDKSTPGHDQTRTAEPMDKNLSVEELRERLRKNLYELYSSNGQPADIDPDILASATYGRLHELVSEGCPIPHDSDLWSELEELVLRCSPNFISNLRLLTGGRLTPYELHTSLLIKCGITPKQMSVLLNRSKGAIVSRRESLCLKVFDEKMGTKVIDGIIRLL